MTATVSDQPPLNDSRWHAVDVTVHDLAPGSSATVAGDSLTDGVVVIPEFNCWFQAGGICHVTSPPSTTTVTFYVLLPASRSQAQVTFRVDPGGSPDPDPSNDTVTVTIRRFRG